MLATFELMIECWSTEWEKKKKVGAGRENLMPIEVGGIVVELFSYLFFIISLFLIILIKLLWYKFFKINIISYYRNIILFF